MRLGRKRRSACNSHQLLCVSQHPDARPPRVCSSSHRTNYYSKYSTESLYQLGGGEYIITYITAEAGLVVGVKRAGERKMDGRTMERYAGVGRCNQGSSEEQRKLQLLPCGRVNASWLAPPRTHTFRARNRVKSIFSISQDQFHVGT